MTRLTRRRNGMNKGKEQGHQCQHDVDINKRVVDRVLT